MDFFDDGLSILRRIKDISEQQNSPFTISVQQRSRSAVTVTAHEFSGSSHLANFPNQQMFSAVLFMHSASTRTLAEKLNFNSSEYVFWDVVVMLFFATRARQRQCKFTEGATRHHQSPESVCT